MTSITIILLVFIHFAAISPKDLPELFHPIPYVKEEGLSELNYGFTEVLARKPVYQGPLPDSFDWRYKRKVSSVKDQQQCDACWAFSITATLESHMMIYRGASTDLDLSEQMLIDCLDGSPGCASASLVQAYAKLTSTLGYMVLENEYPYTGRMQQCQDRQYNTTLSVAGYKRVVQNEEEMKRHLISYGPLTAAINSKSMVNYNENVIDEPDENDCPSGMDQLNHSVEIVGYDYYRDNRTVDKSKQYWIIKNSWGPNWGAQGYYYLILGRNACGISNDVSVPLWGERQKVGRRKPPRYDEDRRRWKELVSDYPSGRQA